VSPVGQNTRSVYHDPRERIAISHPLEAAALLLLGHAPDHVESGGTGRDTYVYGRSVLPDLQRLRQAVNEMRALAERARTSRRTNLRNGALHHEQQPL